LKPRRAPAAKAPALPARLAERIELWPVERLVPYARNPRTHSDDQIARIARSIQEFGFVSPILVDAASAVVIAGHGRLDAARLLGLERVPVVPLEHLTEAQRRAYLIADNRLAELSSWDEQRLRAELLAFDAEPLDMPALGFDRAQLRRLLAGPRPTPAAATKAGRTQQVHECPECGHRWSASGGER